MSQVTKSGGSHFWCINLSVFELCYFDFGTKLYMYFLRRY